MVTMPLCNTKDGGLVSGNCEPLISTVDIFPSEILIKVSKAAKTFVSGATQTGPD